MIVYSTSLLWTVRFTPEETVIGALAFPRGPAPPLPSQPCQRPQATPTWLGVEPRGRLPRAGAHSLVQKQLQVPTRPMLAGQGPGERRYHGNGHFTWRGISRSTPASATAPSGPKCSLCPGQAHRGRVYVLNRSGAGSPTGPRAPQLSATGHSTVTSRVGPEPGPVPASLAPHTSRPGTKNRERTEEPGADGVSRELRGPAGKQDCGAGSPPITQNSLGRSAAIADGRLGPATPRQGSPPRPAQRLEPRPLPSPLPFVYFVRP